TPTALFSIGVDGGARIGMAKPRVCCRDLAADRSCFRIGARISRQFLEPKPVLVGRGRSFQQSRLLDEQIASGLAGRALARITCLRGSLFEDPVEPSERQNRIQSQQPGVVYN